MKIHNYHKLTGEYLSTVDARPDPLEMGQFLTPANATDVDLPTSQANKAPVFNGTGWDMVDDYRGEKYYDKTTGNIIKFELGNSPDASMQSTFPTSVQTALDEKQRVFEIKSAGLVLINDVFPAINDLDEIKFYSEFWKSIAPAARQATADFQKAIDIYSTAKTAITDNTPSAGVVWP